MSDADTIRLAEAVKAKAGADRRLPCAAAFALARELDVSVAAVGRVCNELDVKIVGCQLGCF